MEKTAIIIYHKNMESDALLLIDIQNDFCAGGSMAVPGAEEIIEPVNALLARKGSGRFQKVVGSADWHPASHISFASSHPGKAVYESIEIDGLKQNLWPDHCVAGSSGAAFHHLLDSDRLDLILRKGCDPSLDSYSAFYENDQKTPTGLASYLREFGIETIYIAGLALDWCVYFTAMDGLKLGFQTYVIQDLCRPVDQPAGFSDGRCREMEQKGVRIVRKEEIDHVG